jgi:hypothetical protein
MNTAFKVNNGELTAFDSTTGEVLWRGNPESMSVQRAEPIADTEDALVLLDYADKSAPNHFENLLRCNSVGSVIWRSELPTSSADAYTEFECRGEELWAFSWSGFVVNLSLLTGKVLSKLFTK